VVALREEAIPLWRRLTNRRWVRERGLAYGEGLLGERPVLLTRSGMGRSRAESAAAALLGRAPLSALCAAGFAGALSSEVLPGDLLWADSLLLVPDPDQPVVADLYACTPPVGDLPPLLPATPKEDSVRPPCCQVGALVTTDRVLAWADRKRSLAAHVTALDRPPLAVEMESAGVAAVAAAHRVPFVAIRAVTDGAEEDLPLDFGRCVGRRGELRAGSLAAQIARRPGAIREVMRLGHTSIAASVRLAEFLTQVALRLP
jgi:adenosylhomocysteine nucleosidase